MIILLCYSTLTYKNVSPACEGDFIGVVDVLAPGKFLGLSPQPPKLLRYNYETNKHFPSEERIEDSCGGKYICKDTPSEDALPNVSSTLLAHLPLGQDEQKSPLLPWSGTLVCYTKKFNLTSFFFHFF